MTRGRGEYQGLFRLEVRGLLATAIFRDIKGY